MKAFAVEFPLHMPGLTYSRYLLFHGRQYARSPHVRQRLPMFGDAEKRPLCIVRNARGVPDVFGPEASLVVSARVKEALGPLPSVEYRRVRFARLVEYDPPPGDSAIQDHPAYEAAAATRDGLKAIFRYLPTATPEARGRVGRYFELVVPRLKDVAAEFPEARVIRCARPGTIDQENDPRLSPRLLDTYPIVWWSQTVFAEGVFRRIEPFLDRAYAAVVELEV